MNIKSMLSPPLYEGDEEKTRQVTILNAAGWNVLALLVIAELGSIFIGGMPKIIHLFNIIFLITNAISLYLLHKDTIFIGTLGMLGLSIGYISLILYQLGTVRSPAAIGYILPIMIAGMIFGEKGIYRTTAIISLAIGGLIFLEHTGRIQNANISIGVGQWIVYTALLGYSANLTHVIIRSGQKAREVLKIYSHAIEQSPVAIVIMDANRIITHINPMVSEVTGYDKEEIIGQRISQVEPQKYPPEFYKEIQQTLASKQAWRKTFQNSRKNGELYWEKGTLSPITNQEGDVTNYLGIKEDISKEKEAQRLLEEANQHLKEQLAEIKALQEKLKHQALHDPLTGVYNRHYLKEVLDKEFSRAQRRQYPLSIILIDLDNLKKLNDTGGHATGDQALLILAEEVRASIRKEDSLCRYGGDEFAVILPNVNAQDTFTRAKQLHQRVQALTLLDQNEQPFKISFSAGVASYPTHGETIDEIFNYADVALYRAKVNGRNRVELFTVE